MRGPTESGRFTLLELVRAFALAELGDAEADLRERHTRHFAAAIATASAALDAGEPPATSRPRGQPTTRTCAAGIEHALSSGDAGAAVALALGLRPLWYASMLTLEAHEFVARILAAGVAPADEIKLLQAAVFVAFGQTSLPWVRRLATRTAELGDRDSSAMALCNYFALATNTRDFAEMAQVRPALVALLDTDLGDRAMGWVRYFLAVDDYVDAHFESSAVHAAESARHGQACGHAFLLGCASGIELAAASARDGEIQKAALVEVVERMRAPGIPPLSAFALWLVGRYAAEFDPGVAYECLEHAQRLVMTAARSRSGLRASFAIETISVLGLSEPPAESDASAADSEQTSMTGPSPGSPPVTTASEPRGAPSSRRVARLPDVVPPGRAAGASRRGEPPRPLAVVWCAFGARPDDPSRSSRPVQGDGDDGPHTHDRCSASRQA